MKKSILLLTPVFDMGGTESYILTLAKGLKNIFNITVMSDGGKRENELKEIGILHKKCTCFSKRNIKNFFYAIYIIKTYIKSNNIEMIHTSSIYTTILAKIATVLNFSVNVKVMITLHGGPNKEIEKQYAKLLNIFADFVIALSNNSKEKLIENGLKESKINVIYNGIEGLSKFKQKTNTNKLIIGSCGRLTLQKGYEYLIEALSLIKVNNIECWIIGDGELRDCLKEKISDLKLEDKVKLLGFRENINELLNQIDIFILPSLWEQFPISILEAMSLGKPIIATNVNGVEEELGDTGILIESANSSKIKESLEILLDNIELRQELSYKVENRFNDMFTSKIMINKLLKVYNELL